VAQNNTSLEEARKATCLLVDQRQLNPWLIDVDLDMPPIGSNFVELHLGLRILVFELQQCSIPVDGQTVHTFVDQDIKSNKANALIGYLTIARAIIAPRPIRKSNGWFARVFTSAPKWTQPVAQWKWTSVTEVGVNEDESLVIKGTCRLAPNS